MVPTIDINPLDSIKNGLDKLGAILEALNPANWAELLETGKNEGFTKLLEQMLSPREGVFDSATFLNLATVFGVVAAIAWTVGMIYHASRAAEGEPGHGKEFLVESFWVWGLVPSLGAINNALLFAISALAKFFIAAILNSSDPKTSLLQLVDTTALPEWLRGLFISVQFLLIIAITFELVATMILLPIASLAAILTVALRWAGELGEGLYRATVSSYAVSLGAPAVMVVWFALIIALSTPTYGDNAYAKTFLGLVGLGGAAFFFWPFKKGWDKYVKPKLHIPGKIDPSGGQLEVTGDVNATHSDNAGDTYREFQVMPVADTNTAAADDPDASHRLAGIASAIAAAVPIINDHSSVQVSNEPAHVDIDASGSPEHSPVHTEATYDRAPHIIFDGR